MCRLTAITSVKTPPAMRRLFMHQLMLYSQADWNQRDGAGVADGVTGRKSKYTYADVGIEWLQYLNANRIWHGHVRRASQNTSLSFYEAHPFYFRLADGSPLIASHNGGIKGFNERVTGDPDVDSFRAFKALVPILNEVGGGVTVEAINRWIELFDVGSEWSFMLMHGDLLHVIRGNRTIYYAPFADGYIINTSSDVLRNMAEWSRTFWGDEFSIGNIKDTEEYQMLTFMPGRKKILIQDIAHQKVAPEEKPVYVVMSDTGTETVAL